VIANNHGPARLLLNETTPRGHWLSVRLRGVKSNRDGIGARLTVRLSDKGTNNRVLYGRVHADGSYLSASDVRVHFGVGDAWHATIRADWRGGGTEEWDKIPLDSQVTLREGGGRPH